MNIRIAKSHGTFLALGLALVACSATSTDDLAGRSEQKATPMPEGGDVLTRARAMGAGHEAIAGGVATSFVRTSEGLRPQFGEPSTKPAVEVTLPHSARGVLRVEDERARMAVGILLEGARDVSAATIDGLVVYPHGGPDGADILQRTQPDAAEDFVLFEQRPAREELAYRVSLEGVAGLRLVDDVLELLDEGGAPRLRVAAPYVLTKAGTAPAKLSVEDCGVDTDPRMPWGRRVTPPGASACTIRVSWSGLPYPMLVDPSWGATGTMTTARWQHRAAMLPNGKVLVAGGSSVSSAEIYDPATKTWAATGPLSGARAFQWDLVALATGRVLAVGGGSNQRSAEVYNPATGTWAATGQTVTEHDDFTATLLGTGKVLIAGSTTPELYDPALGTWAATGAMVTNRVRHTAVLLKNGTVLAAGGSLTTATTLIAASEIYDPATAKWTASGALTTLRDRIPVGALLPDGRVLLAGGSTANGSTISTSELYDPTAKKWTATGSLNSYSPDRLTTLNNGKALATGVVGAPELWSPSAGTWTKTDEMIGVRAFGTASLLANGHVLVAGGLRNGVVLKTCELFLSAQSDACTANSDCISGYCTDGVCCDAPCDGDCQSCGEDGKKGTCTVISGKPRGSRAECKTDGTACGGQCNGTSPSCTYTASATVCGCTNGALSSCSGDGKCLDPIPCGGHLVCEGTTACKTTCTADTDCTTGFQCLAGSCVPGTACADDHTSKASDGSTKECAPYKCGTAGECLSGCASVGDCAAGNVCDATGKCVTASDGGSGGDDGGCSVGRRNGSPTRAGFVLLSLALGALVYGRRRARSS